MTVSEPAHWANSGVLERVSDGYLALDRNWCYTYVNGAAARAALRTPEELRGQDFWATFPELPAAARGHLRRAMERHETVHLDVQYEELGLSLRFSVVPTTEGISIYTRDDTARRRAATLHQQMLALNAVLHTDGTVQEVALTVLELALPGVNAEGGAVALLEADGRHMRMIQTSGYPASTVEPWRTVAVETRLPMTDAQRSGRPLFLSESQLHQQYPALHLGAGPRRLACLPLLIDARSIGVLTLGFSTLVPFDEDEQLYLTTLALYTAQVLQRLQFREQEQREAARHRLLLRAGGIFTWSTDAALRLEARSPAWLEFTGRSAGEPSLLASPDVLHPDDHADVLRLVDRGVRSGQAFSFQVRVRRHDGVYRDLDSIVEPMLDAAGIVTGWLGMSRDVTEQQEAARLDLQRRELFGRLSGLAGHVQVLSGLCEEVQGLLGAERVTLWHWEPARDYLELVASTGEGAQRPAVFQQLLAAGVADRNTLSPLPTGGDEDWWVLLPLLGPSASSPLVGQYGVVCRCGPPPDPERQALLTQLTPTLRTVLQRALELRHLEARETKYRTIVEALHEGVIVVEGTTFRTLNSSVRELMHMPDASGEEQTIMGLEQWQYFTPQGEWLSVDRYPVNRSLRGELVRNQLLDARHPSGLTAWWLMNSAPLPPAQDGTPKAVVTLTDVTAQTALQRQLEYHAGHDDLTGLHNRRAFLTHVDTATQRTLGGGGQLAVIQLGLDRFKTLLDALGQQVADEFLRVSARRLLTHLQGRGMAASLSGDQFGVAAEVTSALQAQRLADQLRRTLGQPARIMEHDVTLTASAGLTVAPTDGLSAQTLLLNADLTMQRAKRAGRNTLVTYDALLGEEYQRRREIERRLQRAMSHGELHLAYQPVVTLATGALTGTEALIRWRSAELGPVGPGEFIPIAEDNGLIIELGLWILQQAAQQGAHWSAHFGAPFRVSVNVSALQFMQPHFVASVEAALRAAGLPPGSLDLEITESAVMHDLERARGIIQELKSKGIRVTLDDFGTGHSSLSVLDALPFDRIKLDRNFVWGMEVSHKRQRVVRNTLSMAAALDLEVVAEGIETEAQRDLLIHLGCALGQGYLYSPPVTPADFTVLYGVH